MQGFILERNATSPYDEPGVRHSALAVRKGAIIRGDRRAVSSARCTLGGIPRLLPGFLHRFLAGLSCPGTRLAFGTKLFEFGVGEMLDPDEGVARGANPDEFVELDLDRRAVPVLGVLDQ